MIDERTGRPVGDHGTANQALEWALDHGDGDLGNMDAFLRAWREGDVVDEWPEFYTWLAEQEQPPFDHLLGRTELGGGTNG